MNSPTRTVRAAAANDRESAGDVARERIRAGATRAIVKNGAVASMAEIATACGVSKALLHYHYQDRAHLLADVARRLSSRIIARERVGIDGAAGGTVLDALWRVVDAELRGGELRALLELSADRDAVVRDAVAEAASGRRASASTTAARIFEQLGLVPRMPVVLLGDASVAFIDGLALDARSDRDARVSFDVFWLALLGLGE